MNISLKQLLSEANISGKNVQVYLDLDGVIVNFDKGFKALSGGISAEDFARVKFNGDIKTAKKQFWKLLGKGGSQWWANLEPMTDGMILWNFFKKYNPIILTAGNGTGVREGKTAWVHKHLSPSINPVLAQRGEDKPKYVTNDPNTTHVLIDDTKKNIDAWNNSGDHFVAIHHKSAADSIRKFSEMYIKKDA